MVPVFSIRFVFVLVLMSAFSSSLCSFLSTSFFRLFRVTRILRLIKKARQLNKLFTTLILALPSLFNIGMLLLIFFYIFAIVGVEACGMVQMEGNPGLSPNVNFKNFYYAVLTLFQLCTTEGWVDVAEGCAWRSPTCEAVDPRMCGNPWSFPFIMISMLVGAFVLLNAIVSTVIQVFTDSGFREDTMAVFDIFRRRWAQLDVGRSRQIPVRSFLVILRTLPPPIGPNPFVSDDGPKTEYGRMIALLTDLRIPVSIYGEVHYDQVLRYAVQCCLPVLRLHYVCAVLCLYYVYTPLVGRLHSACMMHRWWQLCHANCLMSTWRTTMKTGWSSSTVWCPTTGPSVYTIFWPRSALCDGLRSGATWPERVRRPNFQ